MSWGKKKQYSVKEVREMFKELLPKKGMVTEAKNIPESGCYYAYNDRNDFERCSKFTSCSYIDGTKDYYLNFNSFFEEKKLIDACKGQYIVEKIHNRGRTNICFERIYPSTFEEETSIFYAVYDKDGNFQYAVKDLGDGEAIGLYCENGVYRIADNQNGKLTKKVNGDNKLCIYFSHFDEKGKKNNRNSFRSGCKKQYSHCIDVDLTKIRDTVVEGTKYEELCDKAIDKSLKKDKKIRKNKENFDEIDVFIDDHGCEIKDQASGAVTGHQCSKARMKEIVNTIYSVVNNTPNVKKICLHNLCCFGATKGVDNVILEDYIKEKLSSKLRERNISLYLTKADKNDELYTSYSEVKIPDKRINFSNVEISTNGTMLCEKFDTESNDWENASVEDTSICTNDLYNNESTITENSVKTNVDEYLSPVSANSSNKNYRNNNIDYQDDNIDTEKSSELNNLDDSNQRTNINRNNNIDNDSRRNDKKCKKGNASSTKIICIVIAAIALIAIVSVIVFLSVKSSQNNDTATNNNTLLNTNDVNKHNDIRI